MALRSNIFDGASERYDRFEWLFREVDTLSDVINEIHAKYHGTKLLLTAGAGREVSIILATSFGKALKTFQAITTTALLGYGEDGGILLRSNIDLLIIYAYMLAAPDTASKIERARDFKAFSYGQHEKHMRLGFKESPKMAAPFPLDEVAERVERWNRTRIADKAAVAAQAGILKQQYYDVKYRFYSSFEHSDANALARYIDEWNEEGPFIGSDPDDHLVELVVADNFAVMAELTRLHCRYFDIAGDGYRDRIHAASTRMVKEAERRAAEGHQLRPGEV